MRAFVSRILIVFTPVPDSRDIEVFYAKFTRCFKDGKFYHGGDGALDLRAGNRRGTCLRKIWGLGIQLYGKDIGKGRHGARKWGCRGISRNLTANSEVLARQQGPRSLSVCEAISVPSPLRKSRNRQFDRSVVGTLGTTVWNCLSVAIVPSPNRLELHPINNYATTPSCHCLLMFTNPHFALLPCSNTVQCHRHSINAASHFRRVATLSARALSLTKD